MEPITSTRNPRVRALAALTRRRERRERGQHLVEGPGPVFGALDAGLVEELWATDDGLALLRSAGRDIDTLPVVPVAEHVLERVADTRTPQGLVALATTPRAALDVVVGTGLLVALEAVADPGNLGTIVRTADAAGATAVVLSPGCADAFGPKAVRAAAGSTYHLPIVDEVAIATLVAACRAAGQTLVGLDGQAARTIDDLDDVGVPLGLVLGNEAHGLAPETVALLDDTVAIPLRGHAESLNVAAAAAIAIYAAVTRVHGRT